MLKTETLDVTLDGHLASLTLTRPELMNRFDADVHGDFLRALHALSEHGDVRAAVLASTGKVFSAGGDFDFMKQAHDDLRFQLRHADIGRQLVLSMLELPFPVVAAVQGPAVGLGATVVLACDAVVGARSATSISDPHVAIGLVAGDGGSLFWPQAMGMLRAKRYLLTGDRLTAEEAFQVGLITDLVDEPDDVLPAARTLAARMAALPPLAVQGTKRALNNTLRLRAGEILDLAMSYETTTVMSEDLLEAIRAFKEKRPGNYAGR